MELLQNFYETTLDALRDAKNERLWFKTMTKLGKLYFDRLDCACNVKNEIFFIPNLREEFNRLARILKQLRQSCQTEEGEDDLKKGTQLLEVFETLWLLGLTLTGRCMPSRSKCTQHRRTTRS